LNAPSSASFQCRTDLRSQVSMASLPRLPLSWLSQTVTSCSMTRPSLSSLLAEAHWQPTDPTAQPQLPSSRSRSLSRTCAMMDRSSPPFLRTAKSTCSSQNRLISPWVTLPTTAVLSLNNSFSARATLRLPQPSLSTRARERSAHHQFSEQTLASTR